MENPLRSVEGHGNHATRGFPDLEVRVIEKPFTSADSMSKVRKLLTASSEPGSDSLATGFKEVWLAQPPQQL
jgi:hypothetical protein